MPTFTPTPEQTAIVSAATDTTSNLLISALAGAAKTSTLILIAEALPRNNILCLAFNKRIAVELQERLPSNCTALTLHSLGYRAWRSFLSSRIVVKDRKTYYLIKDWIEANVLDPEEANALWDTYDDLRGAIDGAKSCGYIPERDRPAHFRSLMTDDEFDEWLDFEPDETQAQLIHDVLIQSIRDGLKGIIDYDDMVYLPTLHPSARFPVFEVIMVDEAQDLSALNHAMLSKLGRGKSRIIAVGDECQSIYGFRGAHEDSMALLRRTFAMDELHLSISFRCPKRIVREAHWRAPSMRWPEWAVDGQVRTIRPWSASDLPDAAVILCRNNAPLFRMAVRLLRAGRFPEIIGNDLTKQFKKTLSKLGHPDMLEDEALAAVGIWLEEQKRRRKNHATLEDVAACLTIFIEGTGTLGGAITKMERILSQSGPIKLMTGHKSKGLEFPDVFILDQHLIRFENGMQEENLLYVMQTRAQSTLTYVDSGEWVDD